MAAPWRGIQRGLTLLHPAWLACRAQCLEMGICVGLTLAGLETCFGLGAPLKLPPDSAAPWGYGKSLCLSIPVSTCCSSHQPPLWNLVTSWGGWGAVLGKASGGTACSLLSKPLPGSPCGLSCFLAGREGGHEREDGLSTVGARSLPFASRMGLGG